MDPVSIKTSFLRAMGKKYSAKVLKVNIMRVFFMVKEFMS
jgi:hypothetical protein